MCSTIPTLSLAQDVQVFVDTEPAVAQPGEEVLLRYRVESKLLDLALSRLESTVPPGLSLLDPGSGSETGTPSQVAWELGLVPSGQSRDATMIVRVDPLFTGNEILVSDIRLRWNGSPEMQAPPGVLHVQKQRVRVNFRILPNEGYPLGDGDPLRIILDMAPGNESIRSATLEVTFSDRISVDSSGIQASAGEFNFDPATAKLSWEGTQSPLRLEIPGSADNVSAGEILTATALLSLEGSPNALQSLTRIAAASPRDDGDITVLTRPSDSTSNTAIQLLRDGDLIPAGISVRDLQGPSMERTHSGDWAILSQDSQGSSIVLVDSQSGVCFDTLPLPKLSTPTSLHTGRDDSFYATGSDEEGRGLLLRTWPGSQQPEVLFADETCSLVLASAERDAGLVDLIAVNPNETDYKRYEFIELDLDQGTRVTETSPDLRNPVDMTSSGKNTYIINGPSITGGTEDTSLVAYLDSPRILVILSDTLGDFVDPSTLAATQDNDLLIADGGSGTVYSYNLSNGDMSSLNTIPVELNLTGALPAEDLPRRVAIPREIAGDTDFTGTIPVNLEHAEGIAGMDLLLRADSPYISLGEPQPGPLAAGFVFSASHEPLESSAVSFSAASPSGLPQEASGTFARIPFEITRPLLLPASVKVEILSVRTYDEDAFGLPILVRTGSIQNAYALPDQNVPPSADFTADGLVDWRDLLWFSEHWHAQQ